MEHSKKKQEENRIGVIDIERKLKALRASWVQRLSKTYLTDGVINAYFKRVKTNSKYILSTTERNLAD